ncbi:MAG: pentapeptide repeat-containing protein [Cyanobacteria bacterium P01_F01_bin.150]
MMRSLRHIGIFFTVVLLLLGCSLGLTQPSYAGSSTAIRVQEKVLDDYSGQDLVEFEMYNEDMEDVNFENAMMSGAVIKGSIMKGANLAGANLSNSFFFQDELDGADLTNTVFTDAMLMQTSFNDATITGADFSYAVITKEHLEVLCSLAEGTNPLTGMDTRESLECR